jgi:hypothetical protein
MPSISRQHIGVIFEGWKNEYKTLAGLGFSHLTSVSLFYRNSISATLSALPKIDDRASTVTSNSERGGGGGSGTEDCSIGSAGSLAKRNQHNKEGLPWDDEDVESGKTVKYSFLDNNQ